MSRRFHGCIALLAGALLSASAASAAAGTCTAAPKPAALEFTLRDPAGQPVRLADYRGRVILVNFWATWCRPCRAEIPWLIELFHAYRDTGFSVLGVSVDEDLARIAPFVATMRMDYPVLVGRGEDRFAAAFGPLLGFPTSVLVARDGTICVRHTGITTREQLEEDIRALLAREPPPPKL